MCGLVCTFLSSKTRSDWVREQIWDIFTINLVQNEQRGREATGVGIIQNDGTRRIWKLPIPASEFIRTEDYLRFARKAFGPETVCLLGHTRKPTKGDVGYSNNNHPILTKNIIGIHNGTILNDDVLFWGLSMPREGGVDSEAIFALLETIPPSLHGKEYYEEIVKRVLVLKGQMTTVSLDIRRPGELMLIKRDMPFSMHYEKSFDALFFSSRYIFLRKAFGRSVVTEALESKQGYLFRAEEFGRIDQRYSEAFTL